MLEYFEFEQKKKYSEGSGTMATVDSNIKMELNKYGLFEEKVINQNIRISDLALSVSPVFNEVENETKVASELYQSMPSINFDERIGYYNSLYVGYVSEGDYRENASSGGMGTWIFKELFDNDLIDFVIHVKKNNDNKNGLMFKYDISNSIEEIKEGAKTRYYPVELSEILKIVQEKPGRYAVIGIPSFIYSIRLLSKENKIISERIKYTIGLICGHQKSSKFSESMAFQVGIRPGDLSDIDFRHKLPNQSASNYGVKMTGIINSEVKTIIKPKSELYGQNWGWGLFKPVSSNFTDDVFNETADIVLGDAWLPEYTSDYKGTNIVIIRNEKIAKLVSKAIGQGRLKMDKVSTDTIFASQSAHYRHTHDEISYRLYKKDINHEWRPQKRVEAGIKDIPKNRIRVQDLREQISLMSHDSYLEAVEKNDFSHFTKSLSSLVNEYQNVYKRMNNEGRLGRLLKSNPIEIVTKVLNILLKERT